MTALSPVTLQTRETTLSWSLPRHIAPSRSAHATAWFIPELGVAVDGGASVITTRPDHVFITHTHADHIFHLPSLKSRRKPPRIYVPAHATGLVTQYLHAAQALTDSEEPPPGHTWTRSFDLIGVTPGNRFAIRGGRLAVDVIGCDHSVPCMGYVFSSLKQKLRPKYSHLSGPEIGEIRAAGVAVTEERIEPLLAILGDTTPAVYTRHPELLRARIIVGECTFLTDEHADNAGRTKHTHFQQLAPIIAENPQTLFVLTHFSLRYSNDDIIDFFRRTDLPNAMPWLAAGDVR